MEFGAHAFIWTGDWTPEGARRAVEGAAEAGLDFVEVPVLRPEEVDVPATRALLERHGLGCTCSLGLPGDAHMPSAPERAEVFLRGAVDVAADLGSPVLTGVTYAHLGTLTGRPPTGEELSTVARVLKGVARYATGKGVSLGVEAVNRYETYLINLSEQAQAMLERVDEPNVFVHLDTYHMNIEEKGFYEPIVSLGDLLRYVHLSESDRGIPGTGNVHWDEVFRGLGEIGYDGRLVMESFAAINEDLMGATALWRDVVGDPDLLIREGLTFLRGKATEHGLNAGG